MESKNISEALLHKASLGKGQPELHIRVGPRIFLVATQTEGSVTLAENTLIGGFGGGSFTLLKDDTPEEDAGRKFTRNQN